MNKQVLITEIGNQLCKGFYVFRFNRRATPSFGERFLRFLQQLASLSADLQRSTGFVGHPPGVGQLTT